MMRKTTFTVLAMLASACCMAAQPGDTAVWAPYDLLVDLGKLPRHYSCDALWYKFHDVLLSIGASNVMEILPYQCEPDLGALSLSPRVHLRFSLLERAPAGRATLRAVEKSVRLAPGNPRSIDDSDCALLRRLKDTLFSALPVEVENSELSCPAQSSDELPFSLSVQALVPAPGSPAAPVHASARAAGRFDRAAIPTGGMSSVKG